MFYVLVLNFTNKGFVRVTSISCRRSHLILIRKRYYKCHTTIATIRALPTSGKNNNLDCITYQFHKYWCKYRAMYYLLRCELIINFQKYTPCRREIQGCLADWMTPICIKISHPEMLMATSSVDKVRLEVKNGLGFIGITIRLTNL